jgi:hypothetical protein
MPSPVVLTMRPVVGGDGRIQQGLSQRLQLRKGILLVEAHQAAVTGDIRRQHCRQSSLHAFAGQRRSSG